MRSDTIAVRIVKIISSLLIYLGVSFLITIIAMAIYSSQLREFDMSTSQGLSDASEKLMNLIQKDGLLITGICNIILIPIFLLMYRSDSKRLVIPEADSKVSHYILLTITGISVTLSLNLLLSISGIADLFASGYESTATVIYSKPIWMQVLIAGIIGPIMEELMFRGIIFRRLRTYCIFPLAMLISGILFGAYHFNVLQFIYACLFGLVLALVYEKYHSIVACIIVHACGNIISIFAEGFEEMGYFLFGTQERTMVTAIIVTVISIICIMLIFRIKDTKEYYEK